MGKKITPELQIIAHALNNAYGIGNPINAVYHDEPESAQDLVKYCGMVVIDVRDVPKEKMLAALDEVYGGIKTKSDWKFYTFKKPDIDRAYAFIAAL